MQNAVDIITNIKPTELLIEKSMTLTCSHLLLIHVFPIWQRVLFEQYEMDDKILFVVILINILCDLNSFNVFI